MNSARVVDYGTFQSVVRSLIRMIINAQKEAAIAQTLALVAAPSLPEATRQQVRQEIGQGYDDLMRSVEEAPVDDVLELLRRFQGTVQ
ncbi:MAG: hypothetical protein LAO04_21940 [Acidobacteriia bacterium]|nr:hypothetical protein [Terriglobia bacterium]